MCFISSFDKYKSTCSNQWWLRMCANGWNQAPSLLIHLGLGRRLGREQAGLLTCRYITPFLTFKRACHISFPDVIALCYKGLTCLRRGCNLSLGEGAQKVGDNGHWSARAQIGMAKYISQMVVLLRVKFLYIQAIMYTCIRNHIQQNVHNQIASTPGFLFLILSHSLGICETTVCYTWTELHIFC